MFFFLDTALAPQRVKLILLWMCSWCLAPPTSCSWTNSSPILGGLNAHPLYTKLSPNHQEVRWRQQSLQQGNGQWEYDQALRQGKWDHPPQKKTPKKVVEKSTSSCLHKKYAVDSSWWKYDLWLCRCVFVGDWFDTWSGAGEDNHFYTPSRKRTA